MDRTGARIQVLERVGADASEREELLAYGQNVFDRSGLAGLLFPLDPEPCVMAWRAYAERSQAIGVVAELTRRLVQLRFPIQDGISQTDAYRAATLRGIAPEELAEATGLDIACSEQLELLIHPTAAGEIPVLVVGDRRDFETLVRALTLRNEPKPVPASMGAAMVAGLNNWDRIRSLREAWLAEHRDEGPEGWDAEFRLNVVPHRELYQDRFILLSRGPYSGVPAAQLGLPEDEWMALSLTIRTEHEATHYFTRRVFGSMRNTLLDELIADYMGITAASGRYRADWFLTMVGLEDFPRYRAGGRLENYRGNPPLSEGAFVILQRLVTAAARNVEIFDAGLSSRSAADRAAILVTLTGFTLEELADGEAPERLAAEHRQTTRRMASVGR